MTTDPSEPDAALSDEVRRSLEADRFGLDDRTWDEFVRGAVRAPSGKSAASPAPLLHFDRASLAAAAASGDVPFERTHLDEGRRGKTAELRRVHLKSEHAQVAHLTRAIEVEPATGNEPERNKQKSGAPHQNSPVRPRVGTSGSPLNGAFSRYR